MTTWNDVEGYEPGTSTDIATSSKSDIELPESGVLLFFTEDGSITSTRLSGTEPKIKFNAGCEEEAG